MDEPLTVNEANRLTQSGNRRSSHRPLTGKTKVSKEPGLNFPLGGGGAQEVLKVLRKK